MDARTGPVKLNIGCGTDYREGFVNIDGSDTLPRVDRRVDVATESLLDHFDEGSVDHILANDILEHHFHWEAVELLRDFHRLLRPGGTAEIRVPDARWILWAFWVPVEKRLTWLFGGQDLPQGRDPEMDRSRREHPQYFCHKYGWTMKAMTRDLRAVGFSEVACRRARTNFVALATK